VGHQLQPGALRRGTWWGLDYQGAVDEWGFWDRLLGGGGVGLRVQRRRRDEACTRPAFPDGHRIPPPPPPLPPIALQQPLVAQLPSSVDFGQDIDASAGLNPYMRLIGGLPNVGQALLHRLSTPRGSLPYDANYGYDVRELLNETMTPTRQAQAQGGHRRRVPQRRAGAGPATSH
jgi:hypothetical protein